MHKILFATIAGLLVTFQPVHAANPATGADSIAAIVEGEGIVALTRPDEARFRK